MPQLVLTYVVLRVIISKTGLSQVVSRFRETSGSQEGRRHNDCDSNKTSLRQKLMYKEETSVLYTKTQPLHSRDTALTSDSCQLMPTTHSPRLCVIALPSPNRHQMFPHWYPVLHCLTNIMG